MDVARRFYLRSSGYCYLRIEIVSPHSHAKTNIQANSPKKPTMNLSTLIMEIIVWCRVAISPLLAGLVLAGIAYLTLPKPTGLIAGSLITLAFLLVGIRMAKSYMKMQQEMHPDVLKKNSSENKL
jgi:hypothetical protein